MFSVRLYAHIIHKKDAFTAYFCVVVFLGIQYHFDSRLEGTALSHCLESAELQNGGIFLYVQYACMYK